MQIARVYSNAKIKEDESNMENGMFDRMGKEAVDELVNGERGWKDANTNVVILASIHLLSNKLMRGIMRPIWWAASCVCAAALLFMVKTLFEFLVR